MRRRAVVLPIVVAVLALGAAGALAQGGPPPPDATPGAVGVSGVPLAAWEARLLDPDQPFTTYVNELATPVP